jgi:hypothetical protein
MPEAKPVHKERPDASQDALRAVEELTESDPVKGEELIESPEMRRRFTEAKQAHIGKRLNQKGK